MDNLFSMQKVSHYCALHAKLFPGWFRSKDTTIHQGEGPIHAIKWRGQFIAFATDTGVKIYDCTTNQRITYTLRPKGSPRAELYRCNLCWENDVTLIIGWADSVKIMQIRVCTLI